MIVSIEGLVPDRRFSPPAAQPEAPPVEADIYTPEVREQQRACEDPGDPVAATKTQPAAPQPAPPVPACRGARRGVPHPEHAPEPTGEPASKTASDSSFPNLDRTDGKVRVAALFRTRSC
jgi:hypothetical protein